MAKAKDKEILKDVWGTATCGEVGPKQDIVSIDANSSVEAACEVLSTNRILSAPIWSEEEKQYIGLFDVADVVAFLIAVFKNSKSKAKRKLDLRTIVSEGVQALPVPVKWVSDLSLRNPVVCVKHSDPLSAAVVHFAKGVHRVCVVGDDGKIMSVLSQSAVLGWLETHHTNDVQPITSEMIGALDMVSHKVVTVDEYAELLMALETMHTNGVSSVAVTKNGYLVGSISLSDTKYMFSTRQFDWLWRSCHDFLGHLRSAQALEHDGKDAAPIFGVRSTTTLDFAIKKMRATKAHRVWVVSPDGAKVEGVVSMTDVFRKLSPAS